MVVSELQIVLLTVLVHAIKLISSKILIMLNQIIFIIIGAIALYYIYYTNINVYEKYQSVSELNQYYYDNLNDSMETLQKFINEYTKMYPSNKDSASSKGKANMFESITQKYALMNSLKILNHVNNNTQKALNLYNVCFRDNNPCNEHCLQLNGDFCKIYNYNNRAEN